MPHHYILHKLNTHPRFHHLKKHLSHFKKTHPKSHGGALVHMHHQAMHHPMHSFTHDTGMHTLPAVIHRKKLHPLTFKI
jgi:hypothetical protein